MSRVIALPEFVYILGNISGVLFYLLILKFSDFSHNLKFSKIACSLAQTFIYLFTYSFLSLSK